MIALQQARQVPEFAQEAVSQFLKEFEMIKAGSIGAFDD